MKSKGSWLWFLVWRTPEHGVQVKTVCGYEKRDALESLRTHCSDREWRQMQREGARLERVFVRPNARGNRCEPAQRVSVRLTEMLGRCCPCTEPTTRSNARRYLLMWVA